MAEPIKNVFISHKHEDDDGLRELKRLVREHGMTWRDYSITADNPNNAHNEDYIKWQILAPRIRQAGCLGCVDISPQTDESGSEMKEAKVSGVQLLKPGEDPAIVLYLVDEAFHQMTLPV